MERMGEEVRKSLRIDEMDGSISRPEISGAKHRSVGGGRKFALRSQVSLWRCENHARRPTNGAL